MYSRTFFRRLLLLLFSGSYGLVAPIASRHPFPTRPFACGLQHGCVLYPRLCLESSFPFFRSPGAVKPPNVPCNVLYTYSRVCTPVEYLAVLIEYIAVFCRLTISLIVSPSIIALSGTNFRTGDHLSSFLFFSPFSFFSPFFPAVCFHIAYRQNLG